MMVARLCQVNRDDRDKPGHDKGKPSAATKSNMSKSNMSKSKKRKISKRKDTDDDLTPRMSEG